MTEEMCPRCGMQQSEWQEPEGFERNGETYCCQGCADETGCTCGD
jgi:hypothetical protein